MTARLRLICLFLTGGAALAAGLTAALAQEDFGFMPKGGKTLLLEVLGSPPDPNQMREIAQARRGEEEWQQVLSDRTEAFSDRERLTLAAYLAVNVPLPEGLLAEAEKLDELAAALPRDGRELAWFECQFCHSLFTSHLTQDRGVQAWLNMFQSPFHRELKMNEQEREEFSRYSAVNMPMKIEDVPPDLRF
ncbi:MAG: hypothetical protein HKM95_13515 [Inquilinus sp.]|nr:hypothetical protein [Inquilinus sp.]